VIHLLHMATTKKRLNISLSESTESAVLLLARRDKVPAATKIRELLEQSLDLLEDEVLTALSEERLSKKTKKTLSHTEVWG
jgi:predicted DNA-binding protein